MSYLQEAQMPAAHRPTEERQPFALSARVALALLLALGLLHGALYALFLPPWGLIDEAQHLHYIQYIAEEQALPVAGELYLSDEIVASLFATQRWETFHWTPPPAPDPQVMGLEGYSYEAYQPPLFYLLVTPLYLALPDEMLIKVYALRAVVVMLSLVTVWALYRTARLLLPHLPHLPFMAGLLLVAIPERAIATSRINNDSLLEVLAALFFLVLTHALVAGLTRRRSLLLGLLLGLAVWVKIPAGLLGVPLLLLLWLRRDSTGEGPAGWRPVGWVALFAAPLGAALAVRNLWLYGDLTGFAAFDQLHRLAPVDSSFTGFVRAVISLPNHFWLVWWKGSDVGQNWLLALFYLLMAGAVACAWTRLGRDLWRERRVTQEWNTAAAAILIYSVTVLVYAVAVMNSYYQGMVPVIQGRFMLPALLPFVLLLVWGLWRFAKGEQILLALVVVLWSMSLCSLFGNLIPYYYYWSGVLQGSMPPLSALSMVEWLMLVYQRALLDKPPFFAPLLLWLPIAYGLMLLFVFGVTLRAAMRSRPQLAGGERISVHS